MNKQELIDKYTAEISRLRPYCPNRYLISEQLKYDLYKEILEDLKQLDEPQKPVVPKFVADWFEEHKHQLGYSIWKLVGESHKSYTTNKLDMRHWICQEPNEPFETLIRMKDGYEVEKEPLYYVRLPYEVWDEEAAELKKEFLYLAYDLTSDETRFFPTKEPRRGFSTKLNEITIKSADERYWAFAVPVEEVVEG